MLINFTLTLCSRCCFDPGSNYAMKPTCRLKCLLEQTFVVTPKTDLSQVGCLSKPDRHYCLGNFSFLATQSCYLSADLHLTYRRVGLG